MRVPVSKWVRFVLRWGIAVAGVWWVVANMSLRDHVAILDENQMPVVATLASRAVESSAAFEIVDPATGEKRQISRSQTVNLPPKKNMPLAVISAEGERAATLLALDLADDLRTVRRLLVKMQGNERGEWITPRRVKGGFVLAVPHPRVEPGVLSLVYLADPTLLWLAVLIFPGVFLLTAYRWHELLKALDIHMGQARVFVLNMVGCFYNSFMPGSTGGDVLKAYYASRQTAHKTHAVMSVVVDRAIGLLALVILGGTMAAWRVFSAESQSDPATVACRRVALGSAAIIAGVMFTLAVLGRSELRKRLGLEWVLSKLPMQKHVQHAVEVMRIYRSRPGLVLWALVVTFPVHITVVASAMLAGRAFNLPIPMGYYFVAVPVIVLAGAIPISPQGAGVMEFFAIQLTRQYSVTVSQAFALTMSIRVVQLLWNLTGGIFVLRGGYHAPTQLERAEMEEDEAATDASS
jgi:hypothetical protein